MTIENQIKEVLDEITFIKIKGSGWKMHTSSVWLNSIVTESKEELVQIIKDLFKY